MRSEYSFLKWEDLPMRVKKRREGGFFPLFHGAFSLKNYTFKICLKLVKI